MVVATRRAGGAHARAGAAARAAPRRLAVHDRRGRALPRRAGAAPRPPPRRRVTPGEPRPLDRRGLPVRPQQPRATARRTPPRARAGSPRSTPPSSPPGPRSASSAPRSGPTWGSSGRDDLATVALNVLYPVLDAALLAFTGHLAFRTSRRSPAMALLLAGMTTWLLADMGYVVLWHFAPYTTSPWLNAVFMVTYSLIGAAASHPSVADLASPASATQAPAGSGRSVLLLTLLVPAGTAIVIPVSGMAGRRRPGHLALAGAARRVPAHDEHDRRPAAGRGGRAPPGAARPADRAAEQGGVPCRPPRTARLARGGGRGRQRRLPRRRPVQARQRHLGPPGGRRAHPACWRGDCGARSRPGTSCSGSAATSSWSSPAAAPPRWRAPSPSDCSTIADEPIVLSGGQRIVMTASIGVAQAAAGADADADALVRDADIALYTAKDSGRATWVPFDQSLRSTRSSTGSASRTSCARPSTAGAGPPALPGDRDGAPATGAWPASRPWPAGPTPSTGRSAPPSSSPSRRTPASSSRSAT